MNRVSPTFILFLLLATGGTVTAQSAQDEGGGISPSGVIRSEIRKVMDQRHVPGLSVGVFTNDRVRMIEGFGWADLEAWAPATAETVYEIGSVTKPFTAIAILALERSGRLSLGTELSSVLPGTARAWHQVTIRQLLEHTSGIPNYSDGDFVELFRTTHTRDEILRMVSDRPLEFEPGSRHRYSNTNYYLLGAVVEELTGETFWDYLRETVFQPLGMLNTGSTQPHVVIPRRAEGYRWVDDAYQNLDVVTPSAVFAAGGLQSTVVDLLIWLQALRAGMLLSQEDLIRMWTWGETSDGARFDYGLGWGLADHFGHKAVFHEGATAAFTSAVLYFPAEDIGVVVLANQYRAAALSIAVQVASQYVDGILASQLDPRPELETAEGEGLRDALRSLGAGVTAHPLISTTFAEALNGDFGFFLQGLQGAVDDSSDIDLLWADDLYMYRSRRFSESIAQVLHYRVTTSEETTYLQVYTTPDGRIADINITRR